MGYSEVHCQLCWTSFNIGRIRQAGEPLNSAFRFAEQGFLPEFNFVTKDGGRRDQCPPEAGCSNVKTTRRSEPDEESITKVKLDSAVSEKWLVRHGDDEDMDWQQDESDEDDEALEWEETDDGEVDRDTESSNAHGENRICSRQSASMEILEELFAGLKNRISIDSTEEDSLEHDSDDNDNNSDENFMERVEKSNQLEHIAGPGCIYERGYNGHNISAEEMIGSGTVQCLVRKFPGWETDATDESWEVTSDYFLSGLGANMQSRDWGGVVCLPIRHGVEDELRPDDAFWSERWRCPMPFHPACMEIFKRVSQQHFGSFNINALGRWRTAECQDTGDFYKRRIDPALQRGLGQEWNHENGDEWLAANPVLVPNLRRVLQPAIIENGALSNENSSAFSTMRLGPTSGNPRIDTQDPFFTLPRELVYLIIGHLKSPEIAALRLSSRAFTHLPIFLWKQLLLREIPWLWEIWDQTDISNWTLIPSGELHEADKYLRQVADELRVKQERTKYIIRQELPEHYDKYCAGHPWLLEDVVAASNPALAQRMMEMAAARSQLVCKLPRDRTNWFVVYTQITRHWKDLKGLRNRERIWKSCQFIAERIERSIKEGKIEA